MLWKLYENVGKPGPGKNVALMKKVFVLSGFTTVLNILLSRCLNPMLTNTFWFRNPILFCRVKFLELFLKNGFAKEIYSGPICWYSSNILFLLYFPLMLNLNADDGMLIMAPKGDDFIIV